MKTTPELSPLSRKELDISESGTRRLSTTRREMALTIGMLMVTAVATALLGRDILTSATMVSDDALSLVRLGVFSLVIAFLVFGNIVYQVSRLGYLTRRARHQPEPIEDIVERDWDDAKPITILVPSYKEDARTIHQTLASAALQHHPNARVVLLLDDPPHPADAESARLLHEALRVPEEIRALLREPLSRVERDLAAMRSRRDHTPVSPRAELKHLLETYDWIVGWFDRRAAETPIKDHTDAHFVRVTYSSHRSLLEGRARQLAAGLAGVQPLPVEAIEREYERLCDVFDVDISTFQRKRYRNITHEANKAANLNAYIDMLGRRVAEVPAGDGLALVDTDAVDAIEVPDATYVLTLDADSLLEPDYALRLATVFEAPGNERIAVVQTPYTAIPNAPGTLERVAGATTDIQYVVHQGFTWCHATFWVGANALLRKRALQDIRTEAVEDGLTVPKYIQDRTVIEDTESTVDLAASGWDLHNYPDRLAFSATPPDFGSLLIQRTRWANGGLLIVPKLVRHLVTGSFRAMKIPSFLVRLHYLTSIATSSIGLTLLLFMPLGIEMKSPWLPLTAVPYFLLYWRDLLHNGYRREDILRVYAFNLMLVPINVAGVLKSIQQGITGARIPFGRTPKVPGRTAAPRWAVLALWGMLAWCVAAAILDAMTGRLVHAAFAGMTGLAIGYAIMAFVGVRASLEDAAPEWTAAIMRALARAEAAVRPAGDTGGR